MYRLHPHFHKNELKPVNVCNSHIKDTYILLGVNKVVVKKNLMAWSSRDIVLIVRWQEATHYPNQSKGAFATQKLL